MFHSTLILTNRSDARLYKKTSVSCPLISSPLCGYSDMMFDTTSSEKNAKMEVVETRIKLTVVREQLCWVLK